jgi:hypothetical protein
MSLMRSRKFRPLDILVLSGSATFLYSRLQTARLTMSCPNDTPKQAPPFEHFAQTAETRAHGLASRPGQPTNGPTPPFTGPLGWHCSARRDRRSLPEPTEPQRSPPPPWRELSMSISFTSIWLPSSASSSGKRKRMWIRFSTRRRWMAPFLFFDEADTFFGKRSEGKDAHERYANIEINFCSNASSNFTPSPSWPRLPPPMGLANSLRRIQSTLHQARPAPR